MSKRVAVIGSGIAGLSAAWLLARSCDVTLIERAPRLGGHTNTLLAETPDGPVAVDTGFIVYNEGNYPNLTALLAHLRVTTSPSDMSFAVSADHGRMEYCGNRLRGLFGQRRNIVSPRHWRMVTDILRFFRSAEADAASIPDDLSIGDFLARHGYSRAFIDDHLLPMSAAIWSTPARSMLEFPAKTFISFFANHGLLLADDTQRPIWRTVTGGAQNYIEQMVEDGGFRVLTDTHVSAVTRNAGGVDIRFVTGEHRAFDEVVFACHADQTLALLGDAGPEERTVLGSFRFTQNRAVLHTDAAMMPRRRHIWSAWNYLRTGSAADERLSLTYWMNRLQPLPTATDLFVTLNPMHDFAPGTVQHTVDYEHPLFDAAALRAQRDIAQVQGVRHTWFAGAWLGFGFHEDGLQSGLAVAERIGGIARPWSVAGASRRVAHNWAEAEPLQWATE